MLTIVITGLVLMRAWRLTEALSSSSDAWKEWELRGAVFLSLALQIALICLGKFRKYFPHHWIRVLTWLAYLSADLVAIYALGMISNMIREIKVGKSLSKMDPHTEISTFWAPFLLLHLGGPDTISAYAIEDNELWLRHLLTLVNQAGLTVYVLIMTWTHPTLSFLAIMILLSGFYKYGERVWVLRAASNEYLKDSLAKSRSPQMDSNKILEECKLKRAEGYNVVHHQVTNVKNYGAIMIDVAVAEFLSRKPSSCNDLEDQEYKCVVGTLLSANRLVNTSQRLFADHMFSMEERDSSLSILSRAPCAWDFKVIEIELGLIYDLFYTKAKAVYTRRGFICRLAIFFSICVALVLFSFTDKRSHSKPDLFLTFLLLGAAIFIELFALANTLFSNQVACWLIENKQWAVFCFINRIKPLLTRCSWSNSMGQYNLISCEKNNSCWWIFLKLLRVDEMAAMFVYQGRVEVTDDIKSLILLKIKEMAARDPQKLPFSITNRGSHALSKHKLLDQLNWSIGLDFDMSILVWHMATELIYYLNDQQGSIESSMSLHLSRYMLYLQFVCPSMLPARIGSIGFQDIYKESSHFFSLRYHIAEDLQGLPEIVKRLAHENVSKENQVKYVLVNGCHLALELDSVSKKWTVINQVWAEMLIYASNKCKARDHARQMQRGSELITHVWLLMAHYGLTDHFQIPQAPAATAEIIVNSW